MNILLIEPSYKNKYPPLGLMKISTYHKNKGDNVIFYKGLSQELKNQSWDRIYITTLFTFHFDLTVKTIRYYKPSVAHTDNIYVGGILATLMPDKLKQETGIKNIITGQLTSSKKIDYQDNINIDELALDYDILEDLNYKYPAGDNYFTYTTRGCPNKCLFCAVPTLEPEFKTTNNLINQLQFIKERYGEKKDLLILDNNVLFSSSFGSIIDDIIKCGFHKNSVFIEPLKFEILLNRLKNEKNQENYLIKKILSFLNTFTKRIKDESYLAKYNSIINSLNSEYKKELIIEKSEELLEILNKYKNKSPKKRYVDFNQGIDAHFLTEDKMKLLSKISVRPLRIAFDSISEKENYEKAVRLAAKYKISEISNYMLYNFHDKPEDLWQRLALNVDLKEELGVHIFSFPMKYIPISNTNREYYGSYWNRKFIRSIQAILLVKKGIVSTKRDFFEEAFGNNIEEFKNLLYMPEEMIIYRFFFKEKGLTDEWKNIFLTLSEKEKQTLLLALQKGESKKSIDHELLNTQKLKDIIDYYLINKSNINFIVEKT